MKNYDVVIVGAGPAGVGILVRLEREQRLQSILCSERKGYAITIVDSKPAAQVGGGSLSSFLCPSNTSACCFVSNVCKTSDASDSIGGDLLENLQESPAAKVLREQKFHAKSLSQVGQWLNTVAAKVFTRFDEPRSRGRLIASHSVVKVVLMDDGTYLVTLKSHRPDALENGIRHPTMNVRAEKIILALGGKQVAPDWLQKVSAECKSKLFYSDNVILWLLDQAPKSESVGQPLRG